MWRVLLVLAVAAGLAAQVSHNVVEHNVIRSNVVERNVLPAQEDEEPPAETFRRLTESGDVRITEADDTRVTE